MNGVQVGIVSRSIKPFAVAPYYECLNSCFTYHRLDLGQHWNKIEFEHVFTKHSATMNGRKTKQNIETSVCRLCICVSIEC